MDSCGLVYYLGSSDDISQWSFLGHISCFSQNNSVYIQFSRFQLPFLNGEKSIILGTEVRLIDKRHLYISMELLIHSLNVEKQITITRSVGMRLSLSS